MAQPPTTSIDPSIFLGTQNDFGTPNPWFTIANQFMPRNLHDVIRWARYITIQSPTTTEVIRKLCTYPITEFILDTDSSDIQDKYKAIFESFKLKQTLQDIGFDYYTLGNVFVSMYFPIQRILICPKCQINYPAKKAEFIEFKNYMFQGTCPNSICGYKGAFQRVDKKSQNIPDMNIIRWNPENIAVDHNSITGESEYYFKIPNDIKKKVQMGHKSFVNSVPWGFIEAIKNNQDFKFDTNNIYHLRNLSTGAIVEGCSVPPLISLYSLVFYQATLRRANEAIAMEHMNPLRVIFPAPNGNQDMLVSMSMRNFVDNIQDALRRHKRDKNFFLIAPGPVGYQPIGGDGKNLLVSQEIQQAEDTILLSLGVSRELLSGTTNWTSSTVGLRMLTNTMYSYVTQIEGLINWIIKKTTAYLNINECKVTLEPFRLADDDILKQNMVELSKEGNISLSTVFEALGMDYNKELERIREDAVAKATNQIKAKFEVDQATFLAAKKVDDMLDRNSDFQSILVQAQQIADSIGGDPAMGNQMLSELKLTNYPLFVMVMKLLEEKQAATVTMPSGEGDSGGGEASSGGGGDGEKGTPGGEEEKKDPHSHHISKY